MGKLKMVSEGERVPNAPLEGVDGQTFTLERYAERPLVLYFYPKADTPGCTNEAKDFSALKDEFDKLGVSVLGVSKDPVKRSEEHTSELQSLMRISYAVFCLKNKHKHSPLFNTTPQAHDPYHPSSRPRGLANSRSYCL